MADGMVVFVWPPNHSHVSQLKDGRKEKKAGAMNWPNVNRMRRSRA